MDTQYFTLRCQRRLCYAEYGVPEGTPVVFFQGTPSSRLMHPPSRITEELSVRLLIVDRPGFGKSEPAPGRTLLDWAKDAEELLDHLGLSTFRVVGVSGGAPYVLATAWHGKERVLAASVCGGSGPIELPGALDGAAPVRRWGYLLARHAPRLFRVVVRHYSDPRRDPEAFIRRYTAHNPPADRRIIAQPDFHAMYRANFSEAYANGSEAFAEEVILGANPWGFALTEISAPVHFWHGAEDTSTPLGMSRSMAALVPRSTLTILPGEGHLFVYAEAWRRILSELLAAGENRKTV